MSRTPAEETLDSLIDELAKVLHYPDEARLVAQRSGFGAGDLPSSDAAGVFWDRVVRAADHGKTLGGVAAIVAQVRARYPGNRFFAAYGERAAHDDQASSGPTPDPTDARRDVHGIELVLVPGGSFIMGSPDDEPKADHERPRHEVVLEPFWLAKTPVTNAQYRRYMNANPQAKEPHYWGDRGFNRDEQPVVGVTWHEARAYCEWAGLRLPTEAQWEYACRAGTTTRYCTGDTEAGLKTVAWYKGNSGGELCNVARRKPNAWGLHDMHGNVWEWCEDTFGTYETEPRPGDGLRHEPVGATSRVIRGGVFRGAARDVRSACRVRARPDRRDYFIGFRPARKPS